MEAKGRAVKSQVGGDFNFLGEGDGEHEGSVAFSDISFPSHVSDLESFHSDFDFSVQSRESLPADDVAVQRCEDGGRDRPENDGALPELPEMASENVDVLLAALKAATLQDSSSDEASIKSNKSASSSYSNLDSSRFISKESFPESVLAGALESWTKESSQLPEDKQDEPPSAILSSDQRETSLVKPSSDSRLSEKFFAPSKTPDDAQTPQNGQTQYGVEKFDRSPWSFSGDSLLFQTPRPEGGTSTLVKTETSSKPASKTKTKPSSSSTPVELNQSHQKGERNSISNDTFQQGRLSDTVFGKVHSFDGGHDDGSNNETFSKRSFETKAKPSSSSTPVELNQADKRPDRTSIPNDTFPPLQDRISDLDFSRAVYNPFDGSLNDEGLENGKILFEDNGDASFFGSAIAGEFSFQSAGDAAKRLDEDEKIFEESHRFEKEDATVGGDQSFSYYILPGTESRKSLSVIQGVNDPDNKGEVRISFGEFFAAKTEELGRLGDGNENRPRPQFSDTRTNKVSPAAMPPRPLYRPSSPEGSERDTPYQPNFTDLENPKQKKRNRTGQSQSVKPVAMVTRSSPYGAEAEEGEGKGGKGAPKNDKLGSGGDTKTSRQRRTQGGSSHVDGEDNGLELNNSTIAALKFCNSSEGSKLPEMSSNELKSLSKTLARANIDDAQEIYKVLVDFIKKKGSVAEKGTELIENSQRLSEVFESGEARRESAGQGGEPHEGDAMTFYHSDTSCEVSPTDPKFRTMSSISSPPLDTSSPKSSGSSIGVQTETHNVEQGSSIPTTLPAVALSSGETGTPVGSTVSTSMCTSGGQYGGSPGQTIHSTAASDSNLPSRHYGTILSQATGPNQRGSSARSPVPSNEYGPKSDQNSSPGGNDATRTMSVTRTITPDPKSIPASISPSRPYGRHVPNSVPSLATKSLSTEQQGFKGPALGYPDPRMVSSTTGKSFPRGDGQETYHASIPRYQRAEQIYHTPQTYPDRRGNDASTGRMFPAQAISQSGDEQYYQLRRTDQSDTSTDRQVSGSSHAIGIRTVSHAGSASCHVLPTSAHAVRLPSHADSNVGHALTGTGHANVPPRHAVAVPGQPFTGNAIADPDHAIPISSHAFMGTGNAITAPYHVVPASNHATYRPIQTGPASRHEPARYRIPGSSSDTLAQSCPTFNTARFRSPETDVGVPLRTMQPRVQGKARTMSGSYAAVYQDRHVAPSKFEEAKTMTEPRVQGVFYQGVGPEDVYNQEGTQLRRPHGWTVAGPRQEEVWNSRTERTSQIQMVIPPVLDFPGVQCVGTSTEADLSIYNPTSRWIRCSSEIVTCTLNGLAVDNQECPFSIRGKTMIGPKLTENIKVDFKCLSAGVYVADMKVISTPVASISGDIETSSAFISLQGFAEEPKLEIIADELRTLDFGEIHHGCNSVKPLRIVNKGMTAVPLKMRICSSSSPGIFIFSKANSADVIPELDLQNTTLKCVVPTKNDMGMKKEALVIWIELAGKNQHCFEKTDDAELLSAGVNIQLDTATVAKILGNIQLTALMGFTKIQIPKAFQMAMCLSSPVGKRGSREFPFTNAGNICANVELTIPKHVDVFSVTPAKFQVRPGMAVMVKVVFTPLCNDSYESVIQVLEPDNSKCYEVLLRGSAVEPQLAVDDGPPILSNKSWLCWTGVDLGNATHQRLFLLNDSSDQSIHFQAMILGEHSDFEIQRMRSEFSRGGASSEQMVLRPKERMPIYVLFAPSSFGVFKSALVLRPDRGPRFQIPLYAYGGKSCLTFLDLKKTSDGYDAGLGEVSLGRRNILKITVKNTGQRAAFVKAICYADFQIRLLYHQTHLSIVPSEFVLPERSSKELVIVYQPLQHDAKACQSELKRVATIAFYHGDEVLRQWYRRNALKKQEFDGGRTSRNLKHEDIRFDKVFQDENCAAEDFDFPDLENYDQIFDGHISQTFLNLLAGSEKKEVHSTADNLMGEESLVMATPRKRRVEPEPDSSAPIKSTKIAEIKENIGKDENSAWSLIPEQLSLKVPVQGSTDSTKKVQLLNFSDRPLEFEMIWPAHCIAVTPHAGTIAPRSQTTINISAWGSILKSGVDLPWSGTAYVKCDGLKKAIAIQIHNPLVSDNSPAPSVIDKPLSIVKSRKDEARLSQTYTAFVKPVKQSQPLKITPTLIDFAQVEVNKASSSTITIENISTSSVRWKISSFAPAYAKVSTNSSELLRTTYPVFSFSTQNGFMRPNQIIKIQVEFRARDAGDYCQIWDCQTNPESPLTSTKVKLELSGKAVVKEASTVVAEKEIDKKNTEKKQVAIASARESLQEHPSKETNEAAKGRSEVYFQSDNVEFSDTGVGQTSTVKIKICNKSTSEHQFRIITPSAPFYMKCTSLVTKPSHYLKVPVYFSPQEVGRHYDATVVFENLKSGESLTVKLRANSL